MLQFQCYFTWVGLFWPNSPKIFVWPLMMTSSVTCTEKFLKKIPSRTFILVLPKKSCFEEKTLTAKVAGCQDIFPCLYTGKTQVCLIFQTKSSDRSWTLPLRLQNEPIHLHDGAYYHLKRKWFLRSCLIEKVTESILCSFGECGVWVSIAAIWDLFWIMIW